MYGTLRFILATIVALSHMGVTLYGYNIGVMSVVIFYILAGMVSYKLISRNYINEPTKYYKDRIKRIFPLYYMVLIFSFIVYLLGAKSYFISSQAGIVEYLSNIFILPLAYYMYNDLDKFTLIPPVWSLAVELQFYILVPFVLPRKKIFLISFMLSFLVYIFATIGFLNTDYFAYRLLIGVLFIFLLGTILEKTILGEKSSLKLLKIIYILIVILSLYIFYIDYKVPYNHETLSALLIGIPLIYSLSKLKNQAYKVIDKYLGNISYPIFLLHFPIIWLFEIFIKEPNIFYILVIILLFSCIFQFFEKKLHNLI